MSDDMCLFGNPDCGVYSICDACARAIGEEDGLMDYFKKNEKLY